MVWHIILTDISIIARIFPPPCGARKNTKQLAKYPHVLYFFCILMYNNFWSVLADKKVIICAPWFIQFVVYSMRNPVVYRTAKKLCFANYLSCYASLNQALFRCRSLNLKISKLK